MLSELTISYVRTELTTHLVSWHACCPSSLIMKVHIFWMHLDCFESLSGFVSQFSLSPLESNLTLSQSLRLGLQHEILRVS